MSVSLDMIDLVFFLTRLQRSIAKSSRLLYVESSGLFVCLFVVVNNKHNKAVCPLPVNLDSSLKVTVAKPHLFSLICLQHVFVV